MIMMLVPLMIAMRKMDVVIHLLTAMIIMNVQLIPVILLAVANILHTSVNIEMLVTLSLAIHSLDVNMKL
jgi:hypothetical protein